MLITRYITSILLMLFPVVVMAQSRMTNFQRVELPRGEIYPYNSDSLLVCDNIYSSLYVDKIWEWQCDAECDTLYHTTYVSHFEWLNREVIMRVGYVDAPYSIEINGEPFAECRSGSTPTEFNISPLTKKGLNRLSLRLSPNAEERKMEGWRERNDLDAGPIRGVSLVARAKLSIRDIFTHTSCYGESISGRIGVVLKSYNLNERESVLRYKLRNASGELVANGLDSVNLRYRNEDTVYLSTLLPKSCAWHSGAATMQHLELELRHENRVVEYYNIPIGLREAKVTQDGQLMVNGELVELRAKRVVANVSRSEMSRLKARGVNTLLFPAGYERFYMLGEDEDPIDMLTICDKEGLYAIVTAPINSSKTGADIMIGGNITNSREWCEEYVKRLEKGYYAVRRHPSVIAYNIASKSLNGYNLYEGYLHLKMLQRGESSSLLIVNLDGGGEWNSDKLRLEIVE